MKVLKFGAVWCNGCLVMRPRWEEIEHENPDLKTEFYDYDNDKAMVEQYGIDDQLPVAVFVDDNGQELKRFTGEVAKDELLQAIKEFSEK
ncbi:hypothetical protein CR970_01325 [Candidatus Saccharibacteria bacterium]|nr:MAG: hypothetical protein CR970_01325 [Candidatus Saccharibacteria bacterium]